MLAAGVVLVAPVLAPLEQRWMERVKAHRGARAAEVAYVAASVTVWVWLVGGRWALSDPLGALAFGAVGDLVAWVYDRLLPRESRAAAPGQAGSKDTRPGRSRAE